VTVGGGSSVILIRIILPLGQRIRLSRELVTFVLKR
jgi:hypothetical protein